jgi:hypothetical protein
MTSEVNFLLPVGCMEVELLFHSDPSSFFIVRIMSAAAARQLAAASAPK